MPSLRRTISSPSVRSSPYPSLSSAVNGASGNRSNMHGHRRSSGSETSARRVLADLEWWRVVDGQCNLEADQELEDRNRDQNLAQYVGRGIAMEQLTGLVSTDVSVEHIATAGEEGSGETSPEPPAYEFAALSITPHSPRRRYFSRESSVSSLDFTPEEPAFDGLRPLIPDEELGFPGAVLPLPGLRRGEDTASPLFSFRAHSFNDFVAFKTDTASYYADFTVSPLSAAPFLCN